MIIIPSLTADVASLSLAVDQKISFRTSPSLKTTHHSSQDLLILGEYSALHYMQAFWIATVTMEET
jgi:hypothetical protein